MRQFIDILATKPTHSLLREFEELTEKRRNPEVNAKESALAALQKYAGQPDVFVSFTKDVGKESHHERGETPNTSGAKLGINPRTPYATPVGIYTYPIDYVIEQKMQVPFAKHAPFLWVVRAADMNQMLDLDNITEDQKEAIIDACPDITMHFARQAAKIKSEAGILWSLMYWQANFSAQRALEATGKYEKPTERWDDEAEEWVEDDDETETDIPNEVLEKRAAKEWTSILRDAGLAGVIDHGNEIIHEHEPHQAFFLDRSALHELELVRNISPREAMSREAVYRQKPYNLIRDLEIGRLNEEEMLRILNELRPFRYLSLGGDDGLFERVAAVITKLPSSVQNLLYEHAAEMLDPRLYGHLPLTDDQKIKIITTNPHYASSVVVTPAVRDFLITNFAKLSGNHTLPLDDATVVAIYQKNPGLLRQKIESNDHVSLAVQKLAVKLFPKDSLKWLNSYWIDDEVYQLLFKRMCVSYDTHTIASVLKNKYRAIYNHTDLVAHQELITRCVLLIPARKSGAVTSFFAHGEPAVVLNDRRVQAKWGELLKNPPKKGW